MQAAPPSITRRAFVALAALGTRAFASPAEPGGTVFPLWPGSPPGGGGPTGSLSTDRNGAVSNVAVPTLRFLPPRQPTGAAVLIAAGGGYKHIEIKTEADPAAAWLQDHGIAAFVLTYRLPVEGWTDGAEVSLQDAQRALRLIRARADRFQVDPERIAALGFSAGGHLLGMASARSGAKTYPAVDAADEVSAKPAATALIYPVITLEPPYDKTSTRRALVGDRPDAAREAAWSVQTHVRAGCPPIFLVQADDDPVSNPENTRIMAAACQRAGVPVEIHRFATGGHGFGMGKRGTPTVQWPGFYATWLKQRGVLA